MIKLVNLIKEIFAPILITEGRIQGEWWFQDGHAVYADGDVGDMNHEAYVLDALRRQVLDALGVDTSNYDVLPDIGSSNIRDEIFDGIKDELTPEEVEQWQEHNDYNAVIISYLTRKGQGDIKDILYYLRGHDDKGQSLDVRNYALIHWGWQRVKENNIQTQTLTSQDLSNIMNGLYDAYGEELDDNDNDQSNISELNPLGEQTFNIEVMSTRSWYEDVPISILEKKNPAALNPYRSRY